jgi:hypothetical protein
VEIGIGSDARSWIRLELADGAAWLRSGVLQGHIFLLIVAFAIAGVISSVPGFAMSPGDMRAMYSPHGMAAVWATRSPGDVIDFGCPHRPAPQGLEGGVGKIPPSN